MKPKVIPSFGIRVKPHLEAAGVDLNSIKTTSVPKSPPWLLMKPKLLFDLSLYKKADTPPISYLSDYYGICSKYPDHTRIFTDGSKSEDETEHLSGLAGFSRIFLRE